MRSSSSHKAALRFWQVVLFIGLLAIWHVATSPTLLPPIYFDNPHKAAFFFGEPLKVLARTWEWFSSGTIYPHLWVTLLETVLAFVIGTVLGLGMGLWLALSPLASALLDPYIKALNSMPRVILAPIFAVWFGLDIASKVALGVGYLILQAEGTFDINSVFAGIAVLTAFALLLDWAVSLAERRLLVWQPRGGETEKM